MQTSGVPTLPETTPAGSLLFGPAGMGLAFLWGFAEGTLFFIVPDVMVSLVAMFRPRRALRHLAFAVIGALVAGTVMYVWASRDGEAARAAVRAVPFVRSEMLDEADRQLQEHGGRALYRAGFMGMPYKLYTVAAPAHFSLISLLLAISLARSSRFLFTWAVFAALASVLRKWGVRKAAPQVIIHLCLWTAFYVFYWSVI